MKKIVRWPKMEARTIALLLGLSLGLGLAVHEVFLVPALVVVLIIAAEWTVEKVRDFLHRVPSGFQGALSRMRH